MGFLMSLIIKNGKIQTLHLPQQTFTLVDAEHQ